MIGARENIKYLLQIFKNIFKEELRNEEKVDFIVSINDGI